MDHSAETNAGDHTTMADMDHAEVEEPVHHEAVASAASPNDHTVANPSILTKLKVRDITAKLRMWWPN